MDGFLSEAAEGALSNILKTVGFVHLHVHSAYSLREGALTIETLVKREDGKLVVFASNFGEAPKNGVTITLTPEAGVSSSTASVYAEGRTLQLDEKFSSTGASFHDDFGPYTVHIYQVTLNDSRL